MKKYSYITAVFIISDLFALPSYSQNDVKLIREDRVWEYVHEQVRTTGFLSVWKMKFDGTEEKYGKTYHIFKAFEGYRLDRTEDNSVKIVENIYPAEYALMREEDGKVYMVNPDYNKKPNPEYMADRLTPDTQSQEFLFYDFTHEAGDVVSLVCQFYNPDVYASDRPYPRAQNCYIVDFLIHDITTADIEGEKCKVYTISSTKYPDEIKTDMGYIEGVGNIGKGTLYRYAGYGYMPDMDYGIKLNNVYDSEGNVIFEGAGLSVESYRNDGIDAISGEHNDADNSKECWYTLTGQRISHPNASGIYIRRDSRGARKVVF